MAHITRKNQGVPAILAPSTRSLVGILSLLLLFDSKSPESCLLSLKTQGKRKLPFHHGLDMIGMCPPKGSCVRHLAPSVVVLRDVGTFKRWGLVESD